jgi:twitching motility protein PilT
MLVSVVSHASLRSELLRKLSELGGSDLHITTGSAPQVRVDGHLRPLEGYRLMTAADTKQLAYSVLTDAQKHRFEENLELDFSFGVKGLSRFRANLSISEAPSAASFAPFPTRSRPSKTWDCRSRQDTVRQTARPDSRDWTNRFG